ncbi:tape measure protein [Pseudomonas sp. NBRC 111125]|uniref:tape measure protein n=1 Tax=Pseudomonas sp. NBRC 111125 TaxID=1661040 RepID=UPI000761EDCE|nr:tape measure protein [Pseudomonas sp. NBRC 111125]
MALTSRLALEVDGRTAEQQVAAVRVALDALTQAGLRTGPALSGVFGTISSSVSSINAATNSLKAAQSALSGLSTAGSKAGQSLSGAASSMSTTGANAAAAEARLAAATRAMNELNQSSLRATASLNGVGGSVTVTTRNAAAGVGGLNSNMSSLRSTALSLAGPLLGLFAGGALTKSIYDASEAYSSLTNRMKLVTSGAGELASAQQAVFDIAQGARQPLTATAELYQRIATNQNELKLSSEGVAGIVSTISKTLAVSGTSAASANAALIQLGQAFASGTLRGEELNSVMEQAPALAQAIAAGMGKTVGELRTLGAAGLLTAEAVVKALQDQEKAVDDLFNKTATTIGASATALSNSFTQLIGKLDQASGTSASISANFLSISQSMDSLTSSGAELQKTIDSVGVGLTVVAAGGLTFVAAKTAIATKATLGSIAGYYSARTAAIAAAEAALNKANADVIQARSAVAAAQANLAMYRSTILQTAAAGKLAEARLAEAAANKIARDATASLAAAQGSLLGVQGGLIGRIGGLLGVLGGPAGLAITVATVVGSYLLFKDSANDATQSLIDQGLSVEETTKKFKELSAEQKRYQEVEWVAKQKEATEAATKSVQQFTREGTKALSVYGYETNQYRDKFLAMLDEVRGGTRTLDSVTQWAKENTSITEAQVTTLAQLASEQSTSSKLAESYAQKLGIITGQTDAAKKSTQSLTESHAESGKQTRAQLAEWEKYIAKLTETRDLLGANEKAEAKYRAVKMGLTAEQTKQAQVVAEQIDTLKRYQDAIKGNDKVQQAALKAQLVALYTQQQAAEDAAAAVKKSHEDAAKAAKESADKQLEQMNRVVSAARNLVFPGAPRQNLGGYGLLTNGGTPEVLKVLPRKTPLQKANEDIARLNETTDPNKSTLKDAKVLENAGQKLLDDARQRYAVLQQQSKEIQLQGSGGKALGTEAKKLIELETEIANLKEKKTLTTSQKQILAMAELNLAQQKQNAALEKANELTKERFENEAKLKAFTENLQSQLELSREGQATELAGAGQSDRLRARLQEDLKIRQDYQKQLDKLTRDYNKIDNPTAADTDLYKGETDALRAALATRMVDQQNYYAAQDAMRSEWLIGVSESWQNYVDIATNYNEQARAATESILGDTTSSISGSIQGIIKGTESLGDAFGNLAGTIANTMLTAFADITARFLVMQALKLAGIETEKGAVVVAEGEKAAAKVAADGIAEASTLSTIATTLAANVSAAVETLASWAPAALVASIGSFGAAAVVGGTALIAAYALIRGISGGFAEGGYTGPGGKYDPAGIVHKGEVVFSQADIKRLGGVSAVEGIRNGNVSPMGKASKTTQQQGASQTSSKQSQAHQVFIVNNSNAVVDTRTGEDGRLEVLIEQVEERLSKQMATGWGSFVEATEQAYGLRRSGS